MAAMPSGRPARGDFGHATLISEQSPNTRQQEANDAGTAHADQSRQDEAVIDNVLADPCRAGTVELDRREVGRVRRQDVVAVACGREGDHVTRRNAYRKRQRHHRGDRGRL